MKNLTLILFYLAMVLAVSCGSKKKLTERTVEKKIHSEKRDIENSEQQTVNAEVFRTKTGRGWTATPVDPSKPSRAFGQDFHNATISTDESQEKEYRKELTETDKSETDKSEIDKKEVTRSRATDSKSKRQSPWVWLAVVIVVLCLGFLIIRFGWPRERDGTSTF